MTVTLAEITRGTDYEWGTWKCGQWGVPWRVGGSRLRDFEQLERRGWRLFGLVGNELVMRRKLPKKKRAT